MEGRNQHDEVGVNPEEIENQEAEHAEALLVNARLRLAVDMLQDLAYDLAVSESAEVVADLIRMSANVQRLLEQREAA